MKAAARINGDEMTVEITVSLRQLEQRGDLDGLADTARRLVLLFLRSWPPQSRRSK